MKKYILFVYFSIVVFGCSEPDYKYYHSQLYPVNVVIKDWGENWERTAFFKNTPISIYLDSRIDVEDYPTIYQGRFEPIMTNTAVLSFDKDIVLDNITLKAETNLLETQYAKIELHTKSKINGRGYGFECYLLSIKTDSYTAKGYYTVYLKAKTEHNYNINDSTVICIE